MSVLKRFVGISSELSKNINSFTRSRYLALAYGEYS